MTPPTGPAKVGLETIVLPAHLMVTPAPEPTVFVLAPTCRYGIATYGVYFYHEGTLAGSTERLNWREAGRTVQSGASLQVRIPDGWEGAEIRLWLQGMSVFPGALIDATPEELVDALAHPFQSVRERALCDQAEKATFAAADAVKKAYRRVKRQRGE